MHTQDISAYTLTNAYSYTSIHTRTSNENYTSNKINEIDDGNIYAMWWQFCKCDVFVNFIEEIISTSLYLAVAF